MNGRAVDRFAPSARKRAVMTTAVVVAILGVVAAVALPEHARPALILTLAAVGVIGLVHPTAALVAVVLGYPLHSLLMRMLEVDFGTNGVDLVLASAWKEVALGSAIAGAVIARRGERLAGWLWPDRLVIALLGLMGVYVLFSPSFVPALYGFRTLSLPVFGYIGWRLARPGTSMVSRMWAAVVVEGVALATLAMAQTFVFGWEFILHYFTAFGSDPPATYAAAYVTVPRAIATFTSPNEFALFMVLPVTLALAAALDPSAALKRRGLLSAGLAVMIFGQALSISRSGLISTALAVGIMAIAWAVTMGRRPAGRRAAIPAGAMLVVALVAVAGTYSRIGALDLAAATATAITGTDRRPTASSDLHASPRASLGTAPAAPSGTAPAAPSGTAPAAPSGTAPAAPSGTAPGDTSAIGHIESTQTSLAAVFRAPLGSGLGTAGSRYLPESLGDYGHPQGFSEVAYLLLALQIGWLGGLLFVVAIAATALRCWRSRERPFGGLGLPMAAVLAGAIVDGLLIPSLVDPAPAFPIWSMAAIAIGAAVARSTGSASHFEKRDISAP